MNDSQVFEIQVTQGEYEALMRLTTPHECQAEHLVQLRHALENSVRRKRPLIRYVLSGMSVPMIQGAEFVLQVNTLSGTKAATLHLNRFRREYREHLERTATPGRNTVA
ncbi:hypothetical protein [Streptomyces sp. NPDC002215]|uniref:hypothetical protein n=1 Tax=Streptomyces sp. NPDC002215 TaxID=3154412 RepID=UPI003320FB35